MDLNGRTDPDFNVEFKVDHRFVKDDFYSSLITGLIKIIYFVDVFQVVE